MHSSPFRAVALPHCEDLLRTEIEALGGEVSSSSPRGVEFKADDQCLYRILIDNRSASRLIFPVGNFQISGDAELYDQSREIPWEEHLAGARSFKIDGSIRSRLFSHSNYPVLKVKDAIVDRLRERTGTRPDIDTVHPDLTVSLRILKETAELGIDLGGGSLHRRDYRVSGGESPLKENLAAAILLRASWPEIAAAGGGFFDPFCGSGTLCIEAALMAGDIAPGLLRKDHAIRRWPACNRDLWSEVIREYRERADAGIARLTGEPGRLVGGDIDPAAVGNARKNAAAAGLAGIVDFTVAPVHSAVPRWTTPGLVATNPPYGERLGTAAQAEIAYIDLGLSMGHSFAGWRLAFLAPDKELGLATGIKAAKSHALANGGLPVSLIHAVVEDHQPSDGCRMFINRLAKNQRMLRSYLKKQGDIPFRLYDKDMPEYSFAVDIYGGKWCHLQEYAAPASIDPRSVRRRRREAVEGIMEFLNIGSESIFIKERRRLSPSDRYGVQQGKQDAGAMRSESEKRICREGDLKFLVNFSDYLDTGLFLDSRELRRRIRAAAKGKSFLNLFAYTCTATVAAVAGGARASVSVDTSRRYLDWGRENMRLNRLDGSTHRYLQSDVATYLTNARRGRERFDLAYVDPPTYSNSKSRRDDFDVQRDQKHLIDGVAALMRPGGTIIFCTNFTKFKLDPALEAVYTIEDTSANTVPPDFTRASRIHRSFAISL